MFYKLEGYIFLPLWCWTAVKIQNTKEKVHKTSYPISKSNIFLLRKWGVWQGAGVLPQLLW